MYLKWNLWVFLYKKKGVTINLVKGPTNNFQNYTIILLKKVSCLKHHI